MHSLCYSCSQSSASKQELGQNIFPACSLHCRNACGNLPNDPHMRLGIAELDSQLCYFYSHFPKCLLTWESKASTGRSRGMPVLGSHQVCRHLPGNNSCPARLASTPLSVLGFSMLLVCASALPTQCLRAAVSGSSQPRGRLLCCWDDYLMIGTRSWQAVGILQQNYNKHRAWLNLKQCLLLQWHCAITHMWSRI